MKSTKFILAGVMMIALLFSSFQVEAKDNYSNKIDKVEDKIKARLANSFMPSLSVEDSPVFQTQTVFGFIERYTPEQLNKLFGLWPERIEKAVLPEGKQHQPDVPSTSEGYDKEFSPEQFVNILGLTF